MSAVITGGFGFLGWHLAARLRALSGVEPVRLGRESFGPAGNLAAALARAEVIYHVAGVNRAQEPDDVEAANIALAQKLADGVVASGRPVRIVFANSIQAKLDNPYGRGKAQAAAILAAAASKVGGSFVDVLLPNLFGEHGRPKYNSFVATFCDLIVRGESPTVIEDREVPLLHAQRAAQVLMEAAAKESGGVVEPVGVIRKVTEVRAQLQEFDRLYRAGEIPSISKQFDLDLFNTYRSYTFPERAAIRPRVHSDARGSLFETLRSHGGTGQAYASTTLPGQTRGEHYHLHKVERFVVLSGRAEIGFRKLLEDEVLTIEVSGEEPTIVDMPTMWVHNLRNTGPTDLITVFWSDQLLDPGNPDQFWELVSPKEASA